MEAYIKDDVFRKEFLVDTDHYSNEVALLISKISDVFDDSMHQLLKDAFMASIRSYLGQEARKSTFILGILNLLKEKDVHFFKNILDIIYDRTG